MTREELKEHCKKTVEQCEMWAIHRGEEPSGKIYEEHKAILNILEQEPCEDAISREDKKHIDSFKYWCETNEEKGTITIPKFVCDEIITILDKFSSVQPSRKGHWIKSRDSYGNNHFTCSECGNDIATQYADDWHDNYCNECGADMRGTE